MINILNNLKNLQSIVREHKKVNLQIKESPFVWTGCKLNSINITPFDITISVKTCNGNQHKISLNVIKMIEEVK